MSKRNKKIDEKVLVAEAIDYRLQNESYERIAEQMKIPVERAVELVNRGLATLHRDPQQQTLLLDLERINLALSEVVPHAVIGEPASIDMMLKLMDRRSKIEAQLVPTTKPDDSFPAIKGRGALHKPTERDRSLVEGFVLGGTPQERIAQHLGIDAKTLRKHYGDIIEAGTQGLNAEAGGKLVWHWRKGNLGALIFHLKTRAGFRETTTHEMTGPEGSPLSFAPPSLTLIFSDEKGEAPEPSAAVEPTE